MASSYIQRADALESECMRAIDTIDQSDLEKWQKIDEVLERICWEPHFVWWPVRTLVGKWRWLRWVKRHKLDTEKFKD